MLEFPYSLLKQLFRIHEQLYTTCLLLLVSPIVLVECRLTRTVVVFHLG